MTAECFNLSQAPYSHPSSTLLLPAPLSSSPVLLLSASSLPLSGSRVGVCLCLSPSEGVSAACVLSSNNPKSSFLNLPQPVQVWETESSMVSAEYLLTNLSFSRSYWQTGSTWPVLVLESFRVWNETFPSLAVALKKKIALKKLHLDNRAKQQSLHCVCWVFYIDLLF